MCACACPWPAFQVPLLTHRPPSSASASCLGGHEGLDVLCCVLCVVCCVVPRSVSVPSAVQHPLDAIGCRWFNSGASRTQASSYFFQRSSPRAKESTSVGISRHESELRTSFVLRGQSSDVCRFPAFTGRQKTLIPARPAEKGNLHVWEMPRPVQPLTASPASRNLILHFQWHNPPILGP